jgi:putative ABC transport system ATP-binding protein
VADTTVVCSNVVKIYESPKGAVQALRGIDLAVAAGSVTAIMGPSGSGKSSLLRILAGLDAPSSGSVEVGGMPLTGLPARRRRLLRRRLIGYVGQRPVDNLQEGLAVRAQLAVAARSRRAPPDRADSLLEELGMSGRAGHRPHELSGGEQQRASLARALVGSPPLLLADEPTAELDRAATDDVSRAIRTLADDRGLAAVIATHDPGVVAVADHVILLRDGAVQSETRAGEERAVIDATGRLQLPKEVLEWYPHQRVRLELDPDTQTVRIWPT